jgi:hypothetical protein
MITKTLEFKVTVKYNLDGNEDAEEAFNNMDISDHVKAIKVCLSGDDVACEYPEEMVNTVDISVEKL